jgi:eukaryotic-like serine/threonine-protein kinase
MTDLSAQQLGNYRLIRLLGQGGFADVYLGEHIYLNTLAAIKVLHTQLTQDMRVHFLGEAQTIARLKHPQIVRVLDFGVENMLPFLVMEYAPNGTLRQRYPRGSRLSLPLIVSYTRQIAGALQYAHDQRLIHRDVKPENMLLGQNNQVLLSDFGIATIAHTSRSLHTQDISGTIAYMAPEQVQGKSRPASDQYSLAIITYEWLTGYCPFQGSFAEIASQHMFAPLPPLQMSSQALPPDVERVLRMALAKDPEARFARVEAYANALEQACQPGLSTLPIATPTFLPPSSTASTFISVSPTKPSPSIAPLNTDPPNISPPASYQSTPGVAPHSPSHTPPTSLPETVIAAPIIDQPLRAISRRAVLGSLLGLTAVVAGGGIAWFTIEHLRSSAASPTVVPQPTSKSAQQPATPVINKPLIHLGPDKLYTVSWSPDGTKVVSAGNGEIIEVWDPVTGNPLFNLVSGSSTVFSVAWSPDGTKIASGQKDGTVKIWDATNGNSFSNLTGHSGRVNSVAWSSDSRYLVSGSGDHTARVWDVASGNNITTYRGHSLWVNGVTWSHNSSLIVSGSGDKTAQVWDAFSGNPVLTYNRHTNEVLALAWSPDNSIIASASDDNTVQLWNATNGNLSLTYSGHSGFVVAMSWSPNGQYIASGGVDTTVQVWKAIDGTLISKYTGHSAEVEGLSWSPDSKRIASASDDKTVQIWQVP